MVRIALLLVPGNWIMAMLSSRLETGLPKVRRDGLRSWFDRPETGLPIVRRALLVWVG